MHLLLLLRLLLLIRGASVAPHMLHCWARLLLLLLPHRLRCQLLQQQQNRMSCW
jgi:hypothetical protein